MTRTIQDTCNDAPVRSQEVQDVTVHLMPAGSAMIFGNQLTFVRGPNHLPRDVVDFALRKWPGKTRTDVFLTDPMGNVLFTADTVYTKAETDEVLAKFRRASSLFLYLRLHGVKP